MRAELCAGGSDLQLLHLLCGSAAWLQILRDRLLLRASRGLPSSSKAVQGWCSRGGESTLVSVCRGTAGSSSASGLRHSHTAGGSGPVASCRCSAGGCYLLVRFAGSRVMPKHRSVGTLRAIVGLGDVWPLCFTLGPAAGSKQRAHTAPIVRRAGREGSALNCARRR